MPPKVVGSGALSRKMEPPRVPTGERGADVQIQVTLVPGFPCGMPVSPSHQIQVEQQEKGWQIALSSLETLPNRDFVLPFTKNTLNFGDFSVRKRLA